MTKIEVRISTPLRRFAAGADHAHVTAASVAEALSDLGRLFPDLLPRIVAADGRIHSFVTLFLNEENVENLDGPQTAVREGDVLWIIPAIAGGSDGKARDAQLARGANISAARASSRWDEPRYRGRISLPAYILDRAL